LGPTPTPTPNPTPTPTPVIRVYLILKLIIDYKKRKVIFIKFSNFYILQIKMKEQSVSPLREGRVKNGSQTKSIDKQQKPVWKPNNFKP